MPIKNFAALKADIALTEKDYSTDQNGLNLLVDSILVDIQESWGTLSKEDRNSLLREAVRVAEVLKELNEKPASAAPLIRARRASLIPDSFQKYFVERGRAKQHLFFGGRDVNEINKDNITDPSIVVCGDASKANNDEDETTKNYLLELLNNRKICFGLTNTGGNPPPPPPPPEDEDEDDTVDPKKSAVRVISTGDIDSEILNRRGGKVRGKDLLKRMYSNSAGVSLNKAENAGPIDPKVLIDILVDVKFAGLKDNRNNSKPADQSEYDDATHERNLQDVEQIYAERVRWRKSTSSTDTLRVEAKNALGVYENVATMTATEDSVTLILDADSVRPTIAGNKATNRQAAGRSLQELLLQTATIVHNNTNVTPKFMHVYTPNLRGNPIPSASKVDVESLINTCFTVVLDSQNIPIFDTQTLQAFNAFKRRPGNDELKEKLALIESIVNIAKTGTSDDKLNALQIYHDYINQGLQPDDPYAAKAQRGIDNTRSKL